MVHVKVTGSRSAAGRRHRLRPGVVLRLVGVAAAVSGGVVLAIVVWRFLVDTSYGGELRDAGGAWAITRVALLAGAAGIAILSVAHKYEPRASPLWVIAGGCGLGLAVLAPLALVSRYPSTEFAKLVAYDANTGAVLWESTTPAAELLAITGTEHELAVVAQIDDRCRDSRFVTFRIDPASGQIVETTPGGDGSGPFVGGGPEVPPAREASGLRWDMATGRIVSDHGWSIQVDPGRGNVPAFVTPDVVYLGFQGRNYLLCSY
jgi:hypothetical protein